MDSEEEGPVTLVEEFVIVDAGYSFAGAEAAGDGT